MLIQKIFAIQNINNTLDRAYLEKVITINQEYKIIVSQVLLDGKVIVILLEFVQ